MTEAWGVRGSADLHIMRGWLAGWERRPSPGEHRAGSGLQGGEKPVEEVFPSGSQEGLRATGSRERSLIGPQPWKLSWQKSGWPGGGQCQSGLCGCFGWTVPALLSHGGWGLAFAVCPHVMPITPILDQDTLEAARSSSSHCTKREMGQGGRGGARRLSRGGPRQGWILLQPLSQEMEIKSHLRASEGTEWLILEHSNCI